MTGLIRIPNGTDLGARIVSHSRECCDREAAERLARHLEGE